MTNRTNDEFLARYSRRAVVATGIKLSYTVPLIAATFTLTSQGGLAAVCPPGYIAVENGQPGADCCNCDCTTGDAVLDPSTSTCFSPGFGDVTDICLTCVGSVQSIP